MTQHDSYQSPLNSRYCSPEILKLFSDDFKYQSWRKLWIALAEAQAELGLPISSEQIQQLKNCSTQIDYTAVRQQEERTKHDVMAHLHAFGDQCPLAKGILHLGATSAYVTDNGDLMQMRAALQLLVGRLVAVIEHLAVFAQKHAEQACLGYTHLQPAQLTTVGKRAAIWTQDFLADLEELGHRHETLRFLGCKGATGTQASFVNLFSGDSAKAKKLDQLVAQKMGFTQLFTVTGQTYPRKQDATVLHSLAGLFASAHKFATDVRLLASHREWMEPLASDQVGSSAMPYKRNPMLCERVCGLARYGLSLTQNSDYTASLQWLERSLDDSSNRRLVLPQAFLVADAVLNLLTHISQGLTVNNLAIEAYIRRELPFLATEQLLMAAARRGGNRQQLHELLRVHARHASEAVDRGLPNPLLDLLISDPDFPLETYDIEAATEISALTGRAAEQVQEFLAQEVDPQLALYRKYLTDPFRITI